VNEVDQDGKLDVAGLGLGSESVDLMVVPVD